MPADKAYITTARLRGRALVPQAQGMITKGIRAVKRRELYWKQSPQFPPYLSSA